MTVKQQLLERLHARVTTDDRHQMERVLAVARVCLAGFSLLVFYIDPTQPSRYIVLAYSLLIVYLSCSLTALVLLQFPREISPVEQSVIHAIDVTWASLLTLFTSGPGSPFFMFFMFVLLGAAFRWGFRQALTTAATIFVLLFVGAVVSSSGPDVASGLLAGTLQVSDLAMREGYLTILALLLAYVASQGRRRRAETSAIARIVARVQVETGFKGTLEAVADEVFAVVGGSVILLPIEERATGRAFLWEARPSTGGRRADETTLHMSELESPRRETYLLPLVSHAWLARRHRRMNGLPSLRVVGLDREGWRISGCSPAVSALVDRLLQLYSFRALAGVSVSLGNDWNGRVLVLDPRTPSVGALRLLQALLRQIAPAVLSVHLVRRLRSRAGAMERARVALELHDGLIQLLVGLEMRVDALRRRIRSGSVPVEADLSEIQQHLRDEILNVRELMQRMKPIDLRPNQLVEFLTQQTERFKRETGISARFVSDLREVALTPSGCRELARIAQEALVNVRKHSKAQHAVVRLSAKNGDVLLTVEDDGQGCDFDGRLSQDEMDDARQGPLVIKERVRAVGGHLTIESHRGHGTRLIVILPQSGHRATAR